MLDEPAALLGAGAGAGLAAGAAAGAGLAAGTDGMPPMPPCTRSDSKGRGCQGRLTPCLAWSASAALHCCQLTAALWGEIQLFFDLPWLTG